MKFSALNVDFSGPSLDFLGLRKPGWARRHQRAIPHKSRYFIVVGKPTVKTVADRHGYAVYHNKLF